MKKLMILAAAFVLNAATAWAESTPVFNETGAFVIARSVKLGETNISVAPKTAGTAQKTCPPGDPSCSGVAKCDSDSDCKEDEYCTSVKVCKPLCERGKTLDKEKCSGETPVCATDNHKSYCACSAESCPKAYKCGKTGNRYACETCAAGEECGCPAGTKSNGSGSCVTCNFDTDCADDQVCENKGTTSSQCKTLICDADKYPENHECKSCSGAISNCVTCNNARTCSGCQIGYDLVDGKCQLHDCGAGKYLDMSDGKCYSCSNGCKSCTGPDACTECENAYNLESGYCIMKTCEAGMYLNSETGECLSCPATCTTCATVMTSSETPQCTSCAEGYKLDEATATCVELNCSDAEYVKGNECLPCSGTISNCLTCSGENTCTVCENGFTLQNGQCVGIDCGAGTYLNMSKNPATCDSCSSPCATCSGSATSCTSCVDGYKLSGSSCVQKSCSEMGYSTSCPSGYDSTRETTGSDGQCYSCSKPGDYCSSNSDCGTYEKCVNNKCVKKSCSEMGYSTSCPSGYNPKSETTGSDGVCYSCSPISGWCSSNSDCGRYEKCVNNKCVRKSCGEMGYSTSCGRGYTATNAGVSGSDGTCYSCPPTPCPSGYSTSTTSCGSGYTLKTSGYSAGKACGYCEAAKCPDGYSVYVTSASCSGNKKLETNGSVGGKACNKCVLKTCAEQGYQTSISCPFGYVRMGSNIASLFWNTQGADGTCYQCVKRECPKGSSTTTTRCSGLKELKTVGHSGSEACNACVCPENYEDNGYGGCSCTRYDEYDYGCGGPKLRVCKGSFVHSDFGKPCTNTSQCEGGCAGCGMMVGATKQGSTCR
ncbi:MAG: hypothetical protein KH347_07560 [Acetobacter sp.]|nr:hypothetical protein [Acetobacter sp.]